MQLPSTLRNSSRLGHFEWHTVHQPTPKSLLAKLRSKMPEVKLLVGETSRLQTQRKLKAPLKNLPASTKLQVFVLKLFASQKKPPEPSFSNKRKASKWWELMKPFPFWDFVASWESSLVPKPGPTASPWVPTSSATEIIVQKGSQKRCSKDAELDTIFENKLQKIQKYMVLGWNDINKRKKTVHQIMCYPSREITYPTKRESRKIFKHAGWLGLS